MRASEALDLVLSKLDGRQVRDEFVSTCPICNSDKKKFYLNTKNLLFSCKRGSCSASGNINTLMKHLGIDGRVETTEKSTTKEKVIKKVKFNPSDYVDISAEEFGLREYMESRGITEQTLKDAQVKVHKKGKALAFFTGEQSTGEVFSVNYRSADKKIWMEAGSKPYLWNRHNLDDKLARIYITEGRIDALTLLEMGIHNVVSVPNGTSSMEWIENEWDLLNRYSEIVFCYDNDQAGDKALEEVKKRLDFADLYRLDLGSHNDVNEFYMQGNVKDLTLAIEEPKQVLMDGVVSLEDVSASGNLTEKLTSCGIPKLDNIFGGIRYGEATLVTGGAGTGKTTFISNLTSSLLAVGERAMVWSGELNNSMLKSWLYSTIGGEEAVDIHKHPYRPQDTVTTIKKDAEKKIDEYVRNRLFVIEGSSNDGFALLKKMRVYHKRYGVKHFVIDNMSIVGLSKKGVTNKYELEEEFIKEVADFMRNNEVHLWILCHPTKQNLNEDPNFMSKDKVKNFQRLGIYDVRGSASLANLASNMLMMMRINKHMKEWFKQFIYNTCKNAGLPESVGNAKRELVDKDASLLMYLVKNRSGGCTMEDAIFGYDKNSRRLYDIFNKEESLSRQNNWNVSHDFEFDLEL